jgi:hypothetical protein
MFMVADGGRRGYGLLLDDFWDEARSHGLPLPTERAISAASFCRARPKITSELLRLMLHEVASMSLERSFASQLWHGRRVFAADGTKINTQRSDDLERAFGVPRGGHCPQLLVSVLFDVCAKLPIDVEVGPFASNERDQLLNMLPSLAEGDVLVLDRGYPAHGVLQELTDAKVDFLIRVPATNTFGVVDSLPATGEGEVTESIYPPEGSPAFWQPIKVRVLRLSMPDGSESVFVTNLIDESFTRSRLSELYHLRWEAEEFYKLAKGSYIGQGQFRSKSPEGVRQEVHALMLFLAVTRVVMAAAAHSDGSEYATLSQKAAVLGVACYITRLFLTSQDRPHQASELRALLERVARARYRRRPGRSAPRRSFLPRRGWSSTGHVRG